MNSDIVAVNSQEWLQPVIIHNFEASKLSQKSFFDVYRRLLIVAKYLFAGGGFCCCFAMCLFSAILIL